MATTNTRSTGIGCGSEDLDVQCNRSLGKVLEIIKGCIYLHERRDKLQLALHKVSGDMRGGGGGGSSSLQAVEDRKRKTMLLLFVVYLTLLLDSLPILPRS